jgi:molybdate transport system permease protein
MSRRGRDPIPWYLVVPGLLAVAFLAIPLVGLLAKAPWGDLLPQLTSEEALQALRLSLTTSVAATALALLLGVPLAVLMSRTRTFGGAWVRALVTLPLVLPPVVGGVALLAAYGRTGVVGGVLYDVAGLQVPFTTVAVVLAEAFVAMPFLVITVDGALRTSDRRLEQAAATLGASRWTVFRRVTLPLIAPSIAAGAVLAWARALGEFGATLTFAGSFPGVTRTLPLAIYSAMDVERSQALALSLVLVIVSAVILVSLRGQFLTGMRR